MPALGLGGVRAAVVLFSSLFQRCSKMALTAPWGLSRHARNRAIHALNGNGKGGKSRRGGGSPEQVVSPGFAQVAGRGSGGRFRRYAVLDAADGDPRGRGHRPPGPQAGSNTSSRAAVAGRAALKSELEAVGYTVGVPMGDSDLLHLHRRRLNAVCRTSLVAAVKASHIVGDDPLCPLHIGVE